jgi:hypothetical protein
MAKRKRLTKSQFITKLERAVKRYGEALVIFADSEGLLRRRKIRKSGNIFVSYKHYEGKGWSMYGQSCFNYPTRYRYRDSNVVWESIEDMMRHDDNECIVPIEMITGIKKKRKYKL